MYLLKYAVKNIGRYRKRMSLLALLYLAIFTLGTFGIYLNSDALQREAYYRMHLGAKVTMVNHAQQQILFSKEQLNSFQQSQLLHKSEVQEMIGVVLPQQSVFDDREDAQLKAMWIASTNLQMEEAFAMGVKQIVEGVLPSKQAEVMISKQFAQRNHLSLQQSLLIQNSQGSETLSLQIVGIYQDRSLQAEENPSGLPVYHHWNEFYTTWETMQEHASMFSPLSQTIDFYLKDPQDLAAFRAELQSKGLPESIVLTQDLEAYEQKLQPIQQLQETAKKWEMGILGMSFVLLILIAWMAMRQRIYEAAVLRSMGMRKREVAGCFLLESILFTSITLLAGMSFASIAIKANWVSLLPQDPLIQPSMHFPVADMLQLVFLALVMAILSNSFALMVLLRHGPRELLSKRS